MAAAMICRAPFRFSHHHHYVYKEQLKPTVWPHRIGHYTPSTAEQHQTRWFYTTRPASAANVFHYLGDVLRTRSLAPPNPILSSFQDLLHQQPNDISIHQTTTDDKTQSNATITTSSPALPNFTKFRPHHLPQAWDKAMETAVIQIQQFLDHSSLDSPTLLTILQPLYYLQTLRRLYMNLGNESEEWMNACCEVPANVQDAVVEQLNKTNSGGGGGDKKRYWFVSLLAPPHDVVHIQSQSSASSSSSSSFTPRALYDSLAALREQFRHTQLHEMRKTVLESTPTVPPNMPNTSKRQSKLEQVEDMYMFLELHQRLIDTVLGQDGNQNDDSTKRLTYADAMLQHRLIPKLSKLEELHDQVAQHYLPTVYEEMERQAQQIVKQATAVPAAPNTHPALTTSSSSSSSFPPSTLPYFTLDGVLGALMAWSRAVLGLAFYEETDRSQVKAWHSSVRLFYVYDETLSDSVDGHETTTSSSSSSSRPGRRVGTLYVDPFQRYYKTRNFWACLVPTAPLTKTPILCLNVPPCWDTDPAMVQLRDVQNIFHEFGHALHVLCSDQDLNQAPHAVDTRELWSCFMEYWLLQDPVRQSLAHFSQWPDTIPSEELQRQREELIMDKIHTTMHHIYEGVLELQLFSQFDPKQGDSLVEFQRRLAEHYRPTDIPAKGDLSTLMGLIHDHCSFEFVLARYHYLISDILAAQVFSVFERKGFQDADAMRQCGLEFRRLLSTPGVTAHDTLDAIAKFSGQKPLLMEHLLKYYPVPAKEEPEGASKAMIS